jgi:putative SOS response-associated peptidase YedK
VIAVPANEIISRINNRMLAILPTGEFPRWLSEEMDPHELLLPFPSDSLAITLQRSRR